MLHVLLAAAAAAVRETAMSINARSESDRIASHRAAVAQVQAQ